MNAQTIDNTDAMCYFENTETVMHSDEYLQSLAKTIEFAQKDIAVLKDQRDQIQKQLADKEAEILKREREVEGFVAIWRSSPLGDTDIGNVLPLANVTSLNEAVAYVLRVTDRKLAPKDIRDRLEQWGYDTQKYETNLVSTLHTVLRRFDERKLVEVINEGHRRNSYKWIGKKDEHSA